MKISLWLLLLLVPQGLRAADGSNGALSTLVERTGEPESVPAAAGDPVTTYGVIINGDSAAHHTANVDRFAGHLKSHYGVADADLIVIATHRGYRSDRRGVEYAARTVAKKADGNDRVVVYTSGHGKWPGGAERYLVLIDGSLYPASDFAKEFLANKAAELIYVGDQCYSGGFAAPLTGGAKRVTAVTATDSTHQSQCWRFIGPYLDAYEGLAGDADGNGRVSEDEAFAAAYRSYMQGPSYSPTWGTPQFRGAASPGASAR